MMKKGDPRWWWSMTLIQWTRLRWNEGEEDAEVLLPELLLLLLLLLVASRRGCSA